MRDLLITLIVFGSIPYIFKTPFNGVLMWCWLGYMNPHRLSWGFAYDMPFAQIVALVTIFSMLITKDKNPVRVTPFLFVWFVFLCWMALTSFFAFFPEVAWNYYLRIVKIQLIIFVIYILLRNKEQMIQLVWVTGLSIAFYGIKGGLYTIRTAGGGRVWGPPGGFIEDNNALALALLMIIPMLNFLRMHVEQTWAKYCLLGSMGLCMISALGSQSRGAFLAILATGGFFWLKSNKKLLSLPIILLSIVLAIGFMPQSWVQRMETIEHYDEDASAMGRINAWTYSVNIASDNITGGGLESWDKLTFALYAPNPDDVHAAHSIYFSVLADHGWFGLFLFLVIIVISWRNGSWVIKNTKGNKEFFWANNLARMLQVSLIAYLSGGTFLSLSYFDLPWQIFLMLSILKEFVKKQPEQINSKVDDPAPKPIRSFVR